MANHLKIQLINFGLMFPSDNSRILVTDIKISYRPIPILWQQGFTYISADNNEIGYAQLSIENFNLYADCCFDDRILLMQPSHDRLFMQLRDGRKASFNSLSMFLDKMEYEPDRQDLHPRKILNSEIKNLSHVIYAADPGVYIYTEDNDETKKSKRAIIFPGHMFNNHLILD